ncbi:MAG: response regulator, partial [Chloroflexi bacterium]
MKPKATILLVEDDQSMLNGMADLLDAIDIGYDVTVFTATNGVEGLEIMAEHTPDLIVSDITMPKMDGFEFLAKVRKHPTWTHIPFIFLTARGDKQEIFKGRLSGADLYITKPFQSKELVDLIKTQLNRASQLKETRIQQLKALKKDILQILNHEFRTPLTYVTAYYEMLADSFNRLSDTENFQEYLRGIQTGCVRLTHLVEDFIQIVELRTGQKQRVIQNRMTQVTNLSELLEEVIQKFEKQATQTRVQIHYSPKDTAPALYADGSSLQDAFGRILDNAIKFTARKQGLNGGNVYVTTFIKDGRFHIEVRDEGIGFPSAVKKQLFELFYQHQRHLLEQQGAGIGLTIAQELVKLHGGDITAESKENEGSTFTIVLPIRPVPTAVSDNLEPSKKQATVLVVEDELHLLEGLKELLLISEGKYRLNVLTATDGKAGLEIMEQYMPDLIISDIMMPHMDGYTFLREVRQNPRWVQIPFIFLTAKGDHRDIIRGRLSGVEEYITKPYDSDELIGLVNKQLDRHFRYQSLITESLEELKQSIIHLITPDFRMPLSTVNQYTAELANSLAQVQTEEELVESLRGIRQGSVRLTRLVEDFITLAELHTGEAESVFNMRAQPIFNAGLII